jgi:hypothetical protein
MFNKVANLVRSCLQKPRCEIFGARVLLLCRDRSTAVSLMRDMEWGRWEIWIYLSELSAMTDENAAKLLALVREFDARSIDPAYTEKARQESETDPDWRQLGFTDEAAAFKKWYPS